MPTDEDDPTFSGFSVGEKNVSTMDPQCASGSCINRDLQGRVTCPEGNLDGGVCLTPSGELVTVPVQPNLEARPVEDLAYCTCRCGGPSDLAPFCSCPRNMICEPFVAPNSGLSIAVSRAGSWCVKP